MPSRKKSSRRRQSVVSPGAALQASESRRQVGMALIALGLVTMAGTVGFVQIEGWDAWKSLYFTLITITTVGYGDEGLSETGRSFAMILLVGGVASASIAFATVVQAAVAQQLAWKARMQKKIAKLRGHVIVSGFGRMGLAVCEELRRHHRTIVVVEQDHGELERAVEQGFLAVEGNACDDEVLYMAGVEHATHLVAAVDAVADNIVTAMTCREINPSITVIARAEKDRDVLKLKRAGVDRVLCPFQSGGRETADFITKPFVAEFLAQTSSGKDGVALAEIHIEEGSSMVGTSLAEYGREKGSRISFVALRRPNEETRIPPRGSERLAPGDFLIVAGDPEQIGMMTLAAKGKVTLRQPA